MSPEIGKINMPEFNSGGLNLMEIELTLALPGNATNSTDVLGTKRKFSEVDLSLGSSNIGHCQDKDCENKLSKNYASSMTKSPMEKAKVVGWPPLKPSRKSAIKNCKYVKVAVDGTPYLRKVDLEMYNSYQQLLSALKDMFSHLTIRNCLNVSIIMDVVNGMEYLPTYEDKDGDWMMLGDVPWKMFVESCKRLRMMKSKDAIHLALRTPSIAQTQVEASSL